MRLLKTLLGFFFVVWALPTLAQTDIHRCIDSRGNALFTDQTCAAMQATAIHAAAKPGDDVTNAASLASTPTEPPPILCAGTYDELRQSVIDAFANRNANRMAGLMLWGGYGSAGAVETIRMLGTLMKQPLLDAGPPDNADSAPAGSSGSLTADAVQDDAANHQGDQLVLHLASRDGTGNPYALRYSVVHRAGCLWLHAVN